MTRQPPANILFIVLVAVDCLLALLAIGSAESLRLFLFFHLGFVGLLTCLLAALYFAFKNQIFAPLPWRALILAMAALLMLSLALDLSGISLITDALAILHRRFRQPYWQTFGLLLAAFIFLPLIYQALRRCVIERRHTDLAVVGGFLLFLCALYLPLGIDNIAHWENWLYLSHLEGRFSWSVAYELSTRFWVAVPHALASIISPGSFVGFHLTHILILWAKSVLLYSILRGIKFARLYAFLASALFLFYPVNSDLLSLRSLPNQFSAMSLLAAAALILTCREHPSRLRLFGIWLALSFNVASNETAYALILVAPLLWLLAVRPPWRPRLAAIWFLAPGAKLAYLALLAGNSMSFYNSYVFAGEWNPTADTFGPVISRLADVMRQTFFDSWLAAIRRFSNSEWLGMTVILLALLAGIAWLLARNDARQGLFSTGALTGYLAGGLLLIIPSVGVLIWLEQYSGDLWRTYFYVPIGASITLFSLIALAASPIKRPAIRDTAIIALCLAVCAPGVTRLFEQRERLTASADNKAILLRNLLRSAPQIEPEAIVLLLTDLSRDELDASDYYELQYSAELDDSMLYVLYGNGVQLSSHFCLESEPCSRLELVADTAAPDWDDEIFQRTLFFKIHRDLAVEVIQDPIAYLDLPIDIPYDASQLYDPDALLPLRAATMLGPATR